mgnify:CR=1 FL=1|jgi:microcystin-dependent protein
MRNAFNPMGVNFMSSNIFIGAICAGANAEEPKGWLICNGQAISRIDYNKLFEVIGTTYGSGDGTNTFNVPNLNQKFPEMDTTKTLGANVSAGLPNITGNFSAYNGAGIDTANGSFYLSNTQHINYAGRSERDTYLCNFDASRSSSIYGNSTTVQPPALIINWFIKY